MFLSSKHDYPYSTNLNSCFPFIPNDTTQFKFLTIVHCDQAQKPDVQLLNERFKEKFKPFTTLFGISNYAVVEHSAAMRIVPNDMVR